MKCPKCGRTNVAEILYGMPAFDDELEARIKAGKVRVGGCCVTDHDPRFHCNKCHSDFGYPPTITTKTGSEDLRDVTTLIHFSVGGFFKGDKDITFKKEDNGAILSVLSLPDYAEDGHVVISEKEWRKLLDKLFCKLCIAEWDSIYEDRDVYDGEQWELRVKLTGKKELNYWGSNAYPPLWKDLKNTFRPYFKKFGVDIN